MRGARGREHRPAVPFAAKWTKPPHREIATRRFK